MTQNSSFSIAGKIREVGLHSAIYGIGSVAQSAVQFLLIPVLTATLTTADFGVYSLIYMASVIAGSIFYLGMTSALPRSYFDYTDPHDRRAVFTTAFLLLLGGAMLQVVLGLAGAGWISRLLLHTDRFGGAVSWALIGSALAFINQFFFAYLRFLRRSVASILLSLMALIGSLGGAMVLLRVAADAVAATFQAIAFAQAAVSVVFIAFYGRHAFTMSLKWRELPVLVRFGVPTVLTSLAVMALDWADRIFLERILSLEHVAIYSVGYRLGSAVNTLMITPFTQIWNPMMLEYRNHGNILEFFSRVVSYYFVACSMIMIAASFFARDLLPIVARRADYAEAVPLLLIVMAGFLLYGSTNIVSAGLIYERRIFTIAAVYYLVALAKIALLPVLIAHLGMLGAAVAALAAYAAIPLVIYTFAKRYYPIRFEWWRLGRIVVFVVAALFYGLVVDPRFPLPLVVRIAVFTATVVAFIAACTDAEEKRRLSALLRRPRRGAADGATVTADKASKQIGGLSGD